MRTASNAVGAASDRSGEQLRRWAVLTCLFASMAFVYSAGNVATGAVFYVAIFRFFGWSRGKTALLTLPGTIAQILCIPLIGSVLDAVNARLVMALGAATAGAALLIASRAHSFSALALSHLLCGVGMVGAGPLACAYVAANWFDSNRGLALGITMAGSALGAAIYNPLAAYLIGRLGWRIGFISLATPMLIIALPILFVVSSRPAQQSAPAAIEPLDAKPGSELLLVLRRPILWILSAANFLIYFGFTGVFLHLVAYQIQLGYSAQRAAFTLGIAAGVAVVGKLFFGTLADRISARRALSFALLIHATSILMLMWSGDPLLLWAFTLVWGLVHTVNLPLIPALVAESLGLRSFGAMSGVVGVFGSIGAAAGPIAVGFIFDRTHSYVVPFNFCAITLAAGSLVVFGCRASAPIAHFAPADSDRAVEGALRKPVRDRL
jgi:predicted MFS family arabinose efflux permease